MIIRFITALNWIVIAFLATFTIIDLFFPSKVSGGDAATKGLGEALVMFSRIALVVLLVLNLIPHPLAKFAAFVLILIPPLLLWGTPKYREYQRIALQKKEAAKPIFEDKNMDAIARVAREGEVDKFRNMFKTSTFTPEQKNELLNFLLLQANSNYNPEGSLQCLQTMFDAGAKLESMGPGYETMHFEAAYSGNLPLLRLLLEKGLNANAVRPDDNRPILFEAIECHQNPEATVRLLLESGADPNVTAVRDYENGIISPLLHAAKWNRWGICAVLLEHGADPNFISSLGVSFRKLFEKADQEFQGDGYTTREDFERVKRLLSSK